MSTGTSSKLLWLNGSGKRDAKRMFKEREARKATQTDVAGAEERIS